MWYHLNLRHRIYMILAGFALITLIGGFGTVWHTVRMDRLFSDIIDTDVAALSVAEQMVVALVNQKGFVSYYFLDGDPDWLARLATHRRIFEERLQEARTYTTTAPQRRALERIASEYQIYVRTKDRVIGFYREGRRQQGVTLLQEAREHFFRILNLCEGYKDLFLERMLQTKKQSRRQAREILIAVVSGIFIAVTLAILLIVVLIKHILDPVRNLTRETEQPSGAGNATENEIKALSRSVRGLIRDADQTHIALQRSREHLLQSEKMAMVGKLAAGTAHSIRNPLTSVKMRLFSLSRTLELSEPQKEDFDVITHEIRHVDTIVQNFLEFSRPPKLNLQRISPSTVVDNAIRLLEHRLKSYHVTVRINRTGALPPVLADPEQLKEVLVNLIINACEAMESHQSGPDSGRIVIDESVRTEPGDRRVAVLDLNDTGGGIGENIQSRIFEPFFTTKEEGTGLGLSIASRIIEEHGGGLRVASTPGSGATFTITLPLTGDDIAEPLPQCKES